MFSPSLYASLSRFAAAFLLLFLDLLSPNFLLLLFLDLLSSSLNRQGPHEQPNMGFTYMGAPGIIHMHQIVDPTHVTAMCVCVCAV
jgi:hypothetical protein